MSLKIEGYVFEDAVGYQVKWKSPFYSIWKLHRGPEEDAILRQRAGGKVARPIGQAFLEGRELGHCAELSAAFFEWCHDQPSDVLKGQIGDLRRAFSQKDPAQEARGRPDITLGTFCLTRGDGILAAEEDLVHERGSRAIQQADDIWMNYELPTGARVEATNGWEDDGLGELVMKVFMSFEDTEPGAPSEAAHFVVDYDTNTGEVEVGNDAELRG